MVRAELDGWAKDFAADHGCGDVTVPFDRVVLRHLPRIEAFLARGLTFTVLAHAITRAGVQRKGGLAYSDKQLNTAVRRARSQASVIPSSSRPRPAPMAAPGAPTGTASMPRSTRPLISNGPHPPSDRTAHSTADLDQDLSDEDIRAARQRMRRADP